MLLQSFIIFFLARYLKRDLKKFSPDPKLDQFFLYWMVGAVVLFLIGIISRRLDIYLTWVLNIGTAYFVYFCYTHPKFVRHRPIITSVIPLAALALIEDALDLAAPSFKDKIDTYLGICYAVALTWLGASMLKSKKQNKALEEQRKKAREEEEKARFMEAQKTELERIVNERTAEITMQKNELQKALENLKATQTQLIHSEKMASLGELTAGIAHEIQNPLNFVNNFSEVNNELIDELKLEMKAGNLTDALHIADSIQDNGSKIMHHGKRADGIVKGMLQHSRTSNGQKESTDLNELADEYLRLSFHGLRAKDKSFNAHIDTAFDEKIGKILLIPQDIGRAFLNLFTNAFYSVSQKSKHSGPDYNPTVSVTTKKEGNMVKMIVRDNGDGINNKALEKIFQPFFTTKPTGQGTGLGLSLSYDIITQGHNGQIKVNTREGEYAEFVVKLPALYEA